MQLKYTHESDFRRERDFGTKISATFEFIAAQFRPLLKCLAYFVLPGTLVLGIGLGLLLGSVTSIMPKMGSSPGLAPDFGSIAPSLVLGGGLSIISLLIAMLLLISTVYGFVRVRLDTPAAEEVHPAQVWAYIRPRLGRMVLALLMLFGLSIGMMSVLGVIMFGVLGSGNTSGAGSVLLIFGSVLVFYIGIFWLGGVLSLYFPILWTEDTDVLTALRRSFYLIKGKWWSTFGLFLIVSFIQTFITYLFAIPMYGVMAVQMLKIPGFESPIIAVVGASIYAVGIMFTYAIPLIALQFQYFNLVERKEGLGMRLLVDTLGQGPAPQASNAHYRPDEEGEY
jgi:hypothetical protein